MLTHQKQTTRKQDMKTEAQLMTEYKATENQVYFAFENALILLQDKYGFNTVTIEFLNSPENDAEYSELVEASLEGIVLEANPKFM